MSHPNEPSRRPLGVGRQVLWVVVIAIVVYPLLVIWLRFETTHVLPNGTVLVHALDWDKGTRIDLRRWTYGDPLIRDVEFLCFDDEAILGTTHSTGPFVWLGVNAPIVRESDPDYDVVRRTSGLSGDGGGCVGYFGAHVGAEWLLDDPSHDWRGTVPSVRWCPPDRSCGTPPQMPAARPAT